jgi:hypothetical protein
MSVGVDQILVVLSVMSSFFGYPFEEPSVKWVRDGGIPPTQDCGCCLLSWDSCKLCSSGVHSLCNDDTGPIERDITFNLAEPLQETRRSGRTVNRPGWWDGYKVY